MVLQTLWMMNLVLQQLQVAFFLLTRHHVKSRPFSVGVLSYRVFVAVTVSFGLRYPCPCCTLLSCATLNMFDISVCCRPIHIKKFTVLFIMFSRTIGV